MINSDKEYIDMIVEMEQPTIMFMGDGLRSLGKCYQLLNELLNAFNNLSRMQQPIPCTTYISIQQHKEIEREQLLLETNHMALVAKIAMALTGMKIEFLVDSKAIEK